MGKPKVWIRTRGKSILVFWEKLPEIQREQKSFKRDREAAEEFAATKRLELRTAGPLSTVDRNVTVKAFGARFLYDLEKGSTKDRGLAFATLRLYRNEIERHIDPVLGDFRLRDVHQQHIESLLVGLFAKGLSYGTVHTIYAVLRRLFGRARHQGVVQVNPVNGVWSEAGLHLKKNTQEEKQRKAMDFVELEAFIRATTSAAIPRAHRALWYVAAKTGVRVGEVLGMRVSDVLVAAGDLNIRRSLAREDKGRTIDARTGPTKTIYSRVFEMSGELLAFMKDYLAWRRAEGLRNGWSSDWLFQTTDEGVSVATPRRKDSLHPSPGGPINRTAALWSFVKVAKEAGLPSGRFSPHGLRHAYASQHLMRGAPILWVAKQLGHSPAVCLRTYAWALPTGDRQWANLLDTVTTSPASPHGSEQFGAVLPAKKM